jgi:hypothetical protein
MKKEYFKERIVAEEKGSCLAFLLVFGVVTIILAILVGPSGCERHLSSWKASAYGSNWLVVQYAQNGSVINHWELKDRSVGSEENSDGIFFKDNDGNVVHLSGHYVFIQTANFESAKEKYLKESK